MIVIGGEDLLRGETIMQKRNKVVNNRHQLITMCTMTDIGYDTLQYGVLQ
jgi:proline racemase